MSEPGITIETRFDVADDRVEELLEGISALVRGCGGTSGPGTAEARVTVQLFPLPRQAGQGPVGSTGGGATGTDCAFRSSLDEERDA